MITFSTIAPNTRALLFPPQTHICSTSFIRKREKISEKGKKAPFFTCSSTPQSVLALWAFWASDVFWRSEMPFARCTKNPCLLALPEMSRIFLLFRPSSSFFSCLKTRIETRPSSFFGRCESISYTFCASTAHVNTSQVHGLLEQKMANEQTRDPFLWIASTRVRRQFSSHLKCARAGW